MDNYIIFVSSWFDNTGTDKSKKATRNGISHFKNNLTTEDCCPLGSDTT
jgi:hypothetical protein